MNQDNNELQKAINEVTQKATNNVANNPVVPPAPSTPSMDPPKPIVEPRAMAGDQNGSETVEAAMASVLPNSNTPSAPQVAPAPSAPSVDAPTNAPTPANSPNDPDLAQAKEQVLRELVPLLANMNIDPEQKYRVYRDMVETLHDNSVMMPAVEAARQITDENTRAEALLELVNIIDEAEKR